MKKVYFETIDKLDSVLNNKYCKLPRIIKNIFCWFICSFNILLTKTYEDKIICILPYRLEKFTDREKERIVKKIYHYFKRGNFLFVFSNNIKEKEQIKQGLQKYQPTNIICSEGKWILSYLILMLLEYISKLQQIEIKEQKIEILINELSDIGYYQIKELAQKVKKIKIITTKINKFRQIEKKLYREYGIAIELSNNTKKSLSNSSIIINIDFPKELICKYKINKNAILINIQEKIQLESLKFNGIIVNDCKINFAKEIREKFKKLELYDNISNNILYESYLYRKDKPENILKQIYEDEVKIEYLIGNKGKINELEFKNLF